MRMDVLEQLLNEGQAVDNEVNAVLRKAGVSDIDGLRNRLYQLRWVKNSPNNKDAVPTVKWIADFAKEHGLSIEERWRDLFKWVWAIIRKKNRLNTTKNRALVDIWKEYPTFREFEEYIDDEEQKLVNGWKDDFGGQAEVVDDDPDEVRMQRIRQDLGKPTFSTPGVVDIYRADTQAEAIRLGKGYSWCISYTTGDNYFYHYRLNPESTAYFCFFKEPQPEYDDVACVIHVSKDGKYRMTNAENDNGSPVVDEERVVYCYPPLEKWLPSMTLTPLSQKERDMAGVRKSLGTDWLNVPIKFLKDNHFSRSELRMLLNMGAGLSDEVFDYILDKYDHGKFNDKDSLINLYAKVTVYPLTKHQEEVIGKNKSLLNFYKERHNGKVEELAKAHMENLIKLGIYDETTNTIEEGKEYVFIGYVDEYPVEGGVQELTISPICQSLKGAPSGYDVTCDGNKYIDEIDLSGVHVQVYNCNAATFGAIECCDLTLSRCKSLKALELHCLDALSSTIKIDKCPALEVIEGLSYFEGDDLSEITLWDLPELKTLKGYLPTEISDLDIRRCPKLDIVKALEGVEYIDTLAVPVSSYQNFNELLKVFHNMRLDTVYLLCSSTMGIEEWNNINRGVAHYNDEKGEEILVAKWSFSESLTLHLLRRALNNLID